MPKKTRSIKVTDQRGEKPWLKKKIPSAYQLDVKEKQKTFLIVCEGQTEELYFKAFPVVTAAIKAVPLGCSATTLVECTRDMAENEGYDEVWCVFDMDYKPDIRGQRQDFNNAIQVANDLGFKCAYSNDSFELWFVLHYQYVDQEYLRTYYNEVLSARWQISYERHGKTRAFSRSIYDKLQGDPQADQEVAISRGRKLFEMHREKVYHLQNPVTTVFELVTNLNQHLRR